jgi:hypothetical protein
MSFSNSRPHVSSANICGISGKIAFQFRRFWQLWQFWQSGPSRLLLHHHHPDLPKFFLYFVQQRGPRFRRVRHGMPRQKPLQIDIENALIVAVELLRKTAQLFPVHARPGAPFLVRWLYQKELPLRNNNMLTSTGIIDYGLSRRCSPYGIRKRGRAPEQFASAPLAGRTGRAPAGFWPSCCAWGERRQPRGDVRHAPAAAQGSSDAIGPSLAGALLMPP